MRTTRAAAAGAARTSESKPAMTSLESTTRRSRYRKRRVAPATAVNTLGQDEPAGALGFPPGRAVGAGACPRPGHLGPVRPADAERDLRQRERRCGRRNGTDRDLDPGRLHARPGATAGDGPRPIDRRPGDVGGARARAVAERPDAAGAPNRTEGPVRPPRPPPACRKAARPRRRPCHRLADGARAPGDAGPSPGAEVDRDESRRPLPDDGSGGAADRVLRVVAAVPASGLLLAGDRTRRLRDRDDEPDGEPPGRRATAPLRLRRARGSGFGCGANGGR